MWNKGRRGGHSANGLTGAAAERQAENHLREHGLTLQERNYRCKAGEIDLIMRHGPTCVFVEVRYRKHSRFGLPAETVDYHKQQKLIRAAQHFLQRHGLAERLPCRFDVVSVTGSAESGSPAIDWIRNAF